MRIKPHIGTFLTEKESYKVEEFIIDRETNILSCYKVINDNGVPHYVDKKNATVILEEGDKVTDFYTLKRTISDLRRSSKEYAERTCRGSVIRSRGAWLTALTDDDKLTEDGVYEFKTVSQLREDIRTFKDKGATKFFIDGGHDAGHSVSNFYDDYQPWVSEWQVEISENI